MKRIVASLAAMAIGILSSQAVLAQTPCPALPNNITNGQMADATKLMQNFSQLKDCIDNGEIGQLNVPSIGVTGAGSPITIKNPSAPAPYDFDLPQTPGTHGQILASQGPGQPMSWVNVPGVAAAPLVDGIPVSRPNATQFTWLNQGTATLSDHTSVNGPLSLVIPASVGNSFRGVYQIPPSPPFTVTAKLDDALWLLQYYSFGVYVSDSAGKILYIEIQANGTNPQLLIGHIPSTTGSQSSVFSTYLAMRTGWFRIYDDGANINYLVSQNGVDWNQIYSETVTNYLTSSPVQAGVMGLSNNTAHLNNVISIWSFELKSGTGTDSAWQ